MTSEENNPFQNGSPSFWDQYLKGRPPLAESLLQRVWNYHASHDGKFDSIHEPGAGAGIHSRRLAEKFSRIIVSDVSASNISMAKDHLRHVENATFRVGPLENYEGIEKKSVDMILAINCIHFMDVEKMWESVNWQLKPGGTFCALIFCHPVLKDPKAQEIGIRMRWRVLQTLAAKEGCPENTWPHWYRQVVAAGNAIPFPEKLFEPGVQRILINCEVDLREAYVLRGKEFEHLPSQVGEKDRVIVEWDEKDWGLKADIPRLKEMIDAIIPMQGDAEMDGLWKELEEYLGDREVEGRFLVSCMLATKRKDQCLANGVH